jgi:hypothetical protein
MLVNDVYFLVSASASKHLLKCDQSVMDRLTQVRGAVAAGLYLFVSFLFCSGLSFSVHLSAGMKGRGGGAPPSSRLARRRRGY